MEYPQRQRVAERVALASDRPGPASWLGQPWAGRVVQGVDVCAVAPLSCQVPLLLGIPGLEGAVSSPKATAFRTFSFGVSWDPPPREGSPHQPHGQETSSIAPQLPGPWFPCDLEVGILMPTSSR